jgi:hypothetical protein
LQGDVDRGDEVRAGVAGVGVRRTGQLGVEAAQLDLDGRLGLGVRIGAHARRHPTELHTLYGVPTHDERLRVPWSWWPVVLLIVAIGVLEIGAGFNYVVLVPVTVFLVGFFVVPLALSARVRIRLVDGVLHAGKESLPVTQITAITPLNRDEARLQLGPKADPAAHLVVRGWIGSAVMLGLANPHPVPYWLVSTRHPVELATAIRQARLEARATR